MPDALRLRFEAEGDGTGELFADVQARGFAGSASAWFGVDQLVEFGNRLAMTYPLPPNAPFSLEGGDWNEPGTVIEQVHVGLKFYPIGLLGRVGFRAVLSSPIHQGDRPESIGQVAVELQTSYEPLRSFARSLVMLARGAIDEVVLQGED